MRVAFLGNPAWAVPTLLALAESRHDVTGVFTGLPSRARRGSGRVPSPVSQAAREFALPVEETATVASGRGLEALRSLEPDALVVVAYGELLPRAVLDLPTVAAVNLHFSLLPSYRGAAPVQNALLHGSASTGITSMLMSDGLDEGDVLLQLEVDIEPTDDAGSLGGRLASLGGPLIVETLDGLAAGTLTPVPQDDAAATFAPKIANRRIDWGSPASGVVNLVRALGPSPGSTTTLRGAPLKVLRGEEVDDVGHPGILSRIDPQGPVVGAGQGSVLLREVAPAGKKRMSGADLCKGFRLQAGERFGA